MIALHVVVNKIASTSCLVLISFAQVTKTTIETKNKADACDSDGSKMSHSLGISY